MDVDIHAQYVAQLTTPFDIDPSLKQLPLPMEFQVELKRRNFKPEKYTVKLQWGPGDCEWDGPLPDESLRHGIVKNVLVDVYGRGIVLSSGVEFSQLDKSTFQSYEQALVDAVRQYITWVRVKTGQSWVDDRFSIRSYYAKFCQKDGLLIEEHFGRNPNKRLLSLHPDDAYSDLSFDDWISIAADFTKGPPRLTRLLVLLKDRRHAEAAHSPQQKNLRLPRRLPAAFGSVQGGIGPVVAGDRPPPGELSLHRKAMVEGRGCVSARGT